MNKIGNPTQIMIFNYSKVRFSSVEIRGFGFSGSGGVASFTDSSLLMRKMIILMNKSWQNGGVFILNYSKNTLPNNAIIDIKASWILKNEALGNGGFIYVVSENDNTSYHDIVIERSRIQKNVAFRGGVIYSHNPKALKINQSRLFLNKVKF